MPERNPVNIGSTKQKLNNMKTIKLNQKLKLNKETITGLNRLEIGNIKGGAPKSDYIKCNLQTNGYSCSVVCELTWARTCES